MKRILVYLAFSAMNGASVIVFLPLVVGAERNWWWAAAYIASLTVTSLAYYAQQVWESRQRAWLEQRCLETTDLWAAEAPEQTQARGRR